MTAYEQAEARVERSERLQVHRDLLLYDWPEGDEHWNWVANAPEDEVYAWCVSLAGSR